MIHLCIQGLRRREQLTSDLWWLVWTQQNIKLEQTLNMILNIDVESQITDDVTRVHDECMLLTWVKRCFAKPPGAEERSSYFLTFESGSENSD